MADNTYDAIVIGSGISGGWAAKELTQKGLKTIMLERGKDIVHVKDYINATKGQWEFPHRGGCTQQMIKNYRVLKRDYPHNIENLDFCNEVNLDYWTNDKTKPLLKKKLMQHFNGRITIINQSK